MLQHPPQRLRSISRITTRAPSAANRRVVASPIPRGEAAPEMMAVLPLSREFVLPWQGQE